ncbi:hypothetical protein BKA80DRAFT_278301 [Phyllosticta citrichinensis]
MARNSIADQQSCNRGLDCLDEGLSGSLPVCAACIMEAVPSKAGLDQTTGRVWEAGVCEVTLLYSPASPPPPHSDSARRPDAASLVVESSARHARQSISVRRAGRMDTTRVGSCTDEGRVPVQRPRWRRASQSHVDAEIRLVRHARAYLFLFFSLLPSILADG